MDDLAQTPKSSKSDTDTQSKKRKRQLEKLDESQLEESHIDEPANFVIASTEMESLRETNRRLKNKIISLKTSAKGNKSKMKLMRRRVLQLEQRLEEQSVKKSAEESEMEGGNIESEDEASEAENEFYEHDPAYEVDDVDMEEDDEDFIEEDIGLLQHNGNLRSEPKHIVFLSQLLLLFNFCHSCKADNPLVEAKAVGTAAVVTSTCHNPNCPQKTTTWYSQPLTPGRTKARAGNFLL
ncbi:Hypothetical predicted protein, partial [Paramuricea clavata]